MNSISRGMLLAAGVLAVQVAGAAAQQNPSVPGGAALKSTTPGAPNDTRATDPASSPSGGSTLKAVTPGDTRKKVIPPSEKMANEPGQKKQQ